MKAACYRMTVADVLRNMKDVTWKRSRALRLAAMFLAAGFGLAGGTGETVDRLAYAAPAAPQSTAPTFFDPNNGWRMEASRDPVHNLRGPLYVLRSRDGGRHWQRTGTIPHGLVEMQGMFGMRVSQLAFATPVDGWAYGSGLYSTHDGGKSWKQLAIHGMTTTISIAGRSIWRLDSSCPQGTCTDRWYAAAAGSDTWLARPLPRSEVTFVRINPTHAYLIALLHPGRNAKQTLMRTVDGGATWTRLPDPCPPGSAPPMLASFGFEHLWTLCAWGSSAGAESKTVYRSDDAGGSWRLVSASGVRYPLHNLTAAGYAVSLALTSANSAWLALGRGTLLHTADGGQTWAPAIPYAQANPLDGGVGPVMFVDRLHGWLFSFPDLLFRTVDGGRHWGEIRLR